MTIPRQRPGKSKQDVQTPLEFLVKVRARLHEPIVLDLAANQENTVVPNFFSEEQNSLLQEWPMEGWCWLNPPYENIRPWVEKAATGNSLVAMLIPASTGSNWWRDWVDGKAHVLLLNGRITFVGHTSPYPKDLALLLYTPFIKGGYEVWDWD